MKAKEVLQLLRISRSTLSTYVKKGLITCNKLPNGYYDYSEKDVYNFLNKDVKREICLYARVSNNKQKKELDKQIELLKQFCFTNGLIISSIYADISSGISFENRKELFLLLDNIIQHKVEKVIITYKDRLSRDNFEFFKYLFSQFGCEIIVMSEVGSKELDSTEVIEDLTTLLHSFANKNYSSKKVIDKIKEIIKTEIDHG
ncbi:MAG: IS607 family transposase [Desulfovibrionaceae bacterium]|nr:IS607 family transposase [Desulfovibrionaceae bacterium]